MLKMQKAASYSKDLCKIARFGGENLQKYLTRGARRRSPTLSQSLTYLSHSDQVHIEPWFVPIRKAPLSNHNTRT